MQCFFNKLLDASALILVRHGFPEDGLGRSLQYAALSKAQEDLSTAFLSHPRKVGRSDIRESDPQNGRNSLLVRIFWLIATREFFAT